jgi:hypothetical protein
LPKKKACNLIAKNAIKNINQQKKPNLAAEDISIRNIEQMKIIESRRVTEKKPQRL